ncbi:DUF1963 domain-containing protein [Alienimonas californiensis]|uniref:DUF1963 domain-containing protein n=1 Tax=Alienimonas californiensis TaxID=2527989 RepID=A0A517P564_9PLAN|nr:DUF1963 domain-containing protein [Alienimonas californiensis]QDT14522.1 hypothetical protein CA12_05970 [Alienimonas californiensis]
MTADEALAALAPWIAKRERPAWRPTVEEGDGAPTDSKFAGLPLLAEGEAWPACGGCGQPLELFLQLDLDALPDELGDRYGSGLVQLFYCTGDCDGGWEPFNSEGVSLCRVLPAGAGAPAAENPGTFPPQRIVGWEPLVDRPHGMEHERLGLVTDYHFNAVPYRPTEVICEEVGFRAEGMATAKAIAERIAPADGDKLAGWPHWGQGPERPACPECGEAMELLFQLDSEANVPFMFGDSGVGHVTQCPTHKQVVAFGWACC